MLIVGIYVLCLQATRWGALGQCSITRQSDTRQEIAPWPRYRGTSQNTGRSQRSSETKAVPWAIETIGKQVCASPAIGEDGTVFIGADDLYAFEGVTGKKIWVAHEGYHGLYSPVIGPNGMLYLYGLARDNAGKEIGGLVCIDSRTGKVRWRTPCGNFFYGAPCIGADGTVYVATIQGALYAIEGNTGKVRLLSHAHEDKLDLVLQPSGALNYPLCDERA